MMSLSDDKQADVIDAFNTTSRYLDDIFYERDFMMSLSDDKQADVIDAFNTTSRYLDDIFFMRGTL